MNSRGLGDTIEKITKATGIKKFVESITDDCGCDKRKEILNRWFQYRKKPKCLTHKEIRDYQKWVDERPITLTGKGTAKGKLQMKDITFLTKFHALVFNTEVFSPQCTSCSGTAKTLTKMIYDLDTVWLNNVKNQPKTNPTDKPKPTIKKSATKPPPAPKKKQTIIKRRKTENINIKEEKKK